MICENLRFFANHRSAVSVAKFVFCVLFETASLINYYELNELQK